MSDLAGHVVAVAGAGGPAGRAVVRRLVTAGATVAAADADEARLAASVAAAREALASAGGTADGTADGVVVDLLDAEATQGWIKDVESTHGRLDGLIHVVGGWRGERTLTDASLEHWALLESLLVRTLQHTSLAAVEPLLRSGRGRFVMVSAAGAGAPTAGNAAYSAAKAAAEAWTLAVADAFAKRSPASEPDAAAAILVVKALVDDAMRAAKPDAAFSGYLHVDDLAETIAGLWGRPAHDLNGTRQWLTDQT